MDIFLYALWVLMMDPMHPDDPWIDMMWDGIVEAFKRSGQL